MRAGSLGCPEKIARAFAQVRRETRRACLVLAAYASPTVAWSATSTTLRFQALGLHVEEEPLKTAAIGVHMKETRFFASIVAVSVLLSATTLAEVDKKTERLWKAKCASCHGTAGKADTEKGQEMKILDMTTAAFQAKKDDEFRKAILDGVNTEKGGVKKEMEAFKDLTPGQVDALIGVIRSFKK